MNTLKHRIEFIDIAKGITMFLVVWGHTASNAELQSPDCLLLTRILYSFHMPLFFFLSGLSISSAPITSAVQWKAFLKKTILTIAFPFFIWALIYCSFNYKNLAWVFYGSWYALGKVASLTSLWFLSCLFISKIFVQMVVSFTGRTVWVAIALAMLLIGVFLPKISIGYPWCLDVAFVASSCILFGIILKNWCIGLGVQRLGLLFGMMVLSVAIFVVSVILSGDNFTNMMMCKAQYGTGLWPFVRAITGGFVILTLSMIIRKLSKYFDNAKVVHVITFIGQYTLGIFILHKPFLQDVVLPWMNSWFGGVLSFQLIRFFSAVIAMAATLPVCNIILHYVPELIGVFSEEKISFKKLDSKQL